MEEYNATIENTYHTTITLNGVEYQTDIVDTAGQVRIIKFQHFNVKCLVCCFIRTNIRFYSGNMQLVFMDMHWSTLLHRSLRSKW